MSNYWAGGDIATADDSGLSYDSSKIKILLCGGTSSSCNPSLVFYKIANDLIEQASLSAEGKLCTMSNTTNHGLTTACSQLLSGYRIVVEPIYGFVKTTSPLSYRFYTITGMAAYRSYIHAQTAGNLGFGDNYFQSYICGNAVSLQKHGTINSPSTPSNCLKLKADGTADVVATLDFLAQENNGYGYDIFYMIPGDPPSEIIPEPYEEKTYTPPSKNGPEEMYEIPETTNVEKINNNINQCNKASLRIETLDQYKVTTTNNICEDIVLKKIQIQYPNVFSAVPSGRNFKFLANPIIKVTEEHSTHFLKNNWQIVYNDAEILYKGAQEYYNFYQAIRKQLDEGFASHKKNIDEGCSESIEKADGTSESVPRDVIEVTLPEVTYKGYDTNGNLVTKTIPEGLASACKDSDYSYSEFKQKVYDDAKIPDDTESVLLDRKQQLEKVIKINEDCYKKNLLTNTEKTITTNDNLFETFNHYKSIDGKSYTGINNIEVYDNVNNYISFKPTLMFQYEYSKGNKSDYETLLVAAKLNNDIYEANNVNQENLIINNNTTFSAADFDEESITDFTYIQRTVNYEYEFYPGNEYCVNVNSADFKKCNELTPEQKKYYKSISEEINYKNPINNNTYTFKSHNFPVAITAEATELNGHFYDVNFILNEENAGIFNDIYGSNTRNFSCDYEVTSDLIKIGTDNKRYLDATYRTISLANLDPNDRIGAQSYGSTGWKNNKGQAVKKNIEKNAKNGSKNTYNPDNLEYSFTLTPKLITAIKDYNKKTESYFEYDLDCSYGSSQCKSKFLTNLSSGKVEIPSLGEVIESNYSSINNFNINDSRNKWKYYLTDESTYKNFCSAQIFDSGVYICPENVFNVETKYINQYRNTGVLP